MPGDASTRIRMYSPSLDVMIRDVMRTLGNIDFEHALEVDKVERSTAAEELKQDVRRSSRRRIARGASPTSTC